MSQWHKPDPPDFPDPPRPKLEGPKLPTQIRFEIIKMGGGSAPIRTGSGDSSLDKRAGKSFSTDTK
jgi:hypothetical protein